MHSPKIPRTIFVVSSDTFNGYHSTVFGSWNSEIRLGVSSRSPEPKEEITAEPGEPNVLKHPCPCCSGRMVSIETFEPAGTPRLAPQPDGIDRS